MTRDDTRRAGNVLQSGSGGLEARFQRPGGFSKRLFGEFFLDTFDVFPQLSGLGAPLGALQVISPKLQHLLHENHIFQGPEGRDI